MTKRMAHLHNNDWRRKGVSQAAKGPLRKIEYVAEVGDGGLFGRDKYHLECGHEAWASTATMFRVRCHKCRDSKQAV